MKQYQKTIYASYGGYITQAIIVNMAPLLFLTFQRTYGFTLEQIGLLITINFGVQLSVDLAAARYADRIGYRTCIVAAHIFAAAGLVSMGILPDIMSNAYIGLCTAVVLYAVGGGLIEVLISPLVEACPTEHKASAMSLLHSFYCWGQVGVIIISTLFFEVFGIWHWRILIYIWAAFPIANAVFFMKVPIWKLTADEEKLPLRKLISRRVFWVFLLLMVCAGASELAMSQWASAFAEEGLKVGKTVGDLLGPCLFAVFMGLSRVFYGRHGNRIDLTRFMVGSAVLCVLAYLTAILAPWPFLSLLGCALCGLSVGIMWPGVYSLGAKRLPAGGTAMFAMFAVAGDLGCMTGPAIVGMAAGRAGGEIGRGLAAALVFPCVMLAALVLQKMRRVEKAVG